MQTALSGEAIFPAPTKLWVLRLCSRRCAACEVRFVRNLGASPVPKLICIVTDQLGGSAGSEEDWCEEYLRDHAPRRSALCDLSLVLGLRCLEGSVFRCCTYAIMKASPLEGFTALLT